MWVLLFAISIGLGTETLVGHSVGAGDMERAHRELIASVKKGLAWALEVSVLVALAAPFALSQFTSDPEVLAGAVRLQQLGILLETGRVFNVATVNGLRATGDARFPLLMLARCGGCGCRWHGGSDGTRAGG